MREDEYTNVHNVATVRAMFRLIGEVMTDGKNITESERGHIGRALDTWLARLERANSASARRENKEPHRIVFPSYIGMTDGGKNIVVRICDNCGHTATHIKGCPDLTPP